MSLPIIPELPDNCNIEGAICQILVSIAMEEVGLSHIINAEGEKLQYILGTLHGDKAATPTPKPAATVEDVLEVNESVKDMLQQVAFNQMLLNAKMCSALKAYFENKKIHDKDDDDDKDDGGDGDGGGDNPGGGTSQKFPIKDGEPFQPIVNLSDLPNNYSLIVKIDTVNDNVKFFQNGAIKLKDIISTDKMPNFDGISVKTKNPDLAQHFWIGKDKNGEDDAIIYDYYPPDKDFLEVSPEMPRIPEKLILCKDGYDDAEINVILRYDGSHYVYTPVTQ